MVDRSSLKPSLPLDASTTMRNAGMLLAQRIPQLAASLLIAVLIPRTFGPSVYGRYVLLTSLSMWFILASGLGFTQAIARQLPDLRHDPDALSAFVGKLLTIRIASGVVAAGLYFAATAIWLREIDLLTLALIAIAVLARTIVSLLFEIFLGLNQAARWGLGQVLRSWISLGLVLLGYVAAGLNGVAVSLVVTEIILLGIAWRWSRRAFAGFSPQWPLAGIWPLVRLGLVFYASDLVLSAYRRSGEALVRLITRDYTQVAHFGLAYDVYLTAAMWLPQLVLAFGPYIATLLPQGAEVVRKNVEQLLKALAILTTLLVLATLFLGPQVVPLVLGRAYQPVAMNLIPLVLNLIFVGLADVERLVALVTDHPYPVLLWAIVRLAAYWATAPLFIARHGALGGCVAILIVNAGSTLGLTFSVRRFMPHEVRGWLAAVGLGAPAALLALWPSPHVALRIASFAVAAALYLTLLILFRIVRRDELRAIIARLAPSQRISSSLEAEL